MEIIIQIDERWYEKDFVIFINSLFKETKVNKKIIFIVKKDTSYAVKNQIKRIIEKGNAIKVKNLKEAKSIVREDIILQIISPILFYYNWDIQMLKAIEKLGTNYNYVPSFVNHFGEQLSILDKVYPDNILFDLDYSRDPMKKQNINWFNKLCKLQYKEIEKYFDWIKIFTSKTMEEKPTICILSCAVAMLKR